MQRSLLNDLAESPVAIICGDDRFPPDEPLVDLRKILICDSNPVLAEAVRQLLLEDALLSAFSIVTHAEFDLEQIQALRPDILICDPWQHPQFGEDPKEIYSDLTASAFLIAYCPEISATDAQALSLAGFRAVMPKTVQSEELVRVVCAVAFGGTYVHESYKVSPPGPASDFPDSMRSATLTDREMDVLRQVALGSSIKQIATLLKISTKTVDTYKTRANQKLNLRSRLDIVRYAIRSGWMN